MNEPATAQAQLVCTTAEGTNHVLKRLLEESWIPITPADNRLTDAADKAYLDTMATTW